MGNVSVFFSDKYNLINNDNNNFNLGWLLDFRNLVETTKFIQLMAQAPRTNKIMLLQERFH